MVDDEEKAQTAAGLRMEVEQVRAGGRGLQERGILKKVSISVTLMHGRVRRPSHLHLC